MTFYDHGRPPPPLSPEGLPIDPSVATQPYDPAGWNTAPLPQASPYDTMPRPEWSPSAGAQAPVVPWDRNNEMVQQPDVIDAWVNEVSARGNIVRFTPQGAFEVDARSGEVIGVAPPTQQYRMQ